MAQVSRRSVLLGATAMLPVCPASAFLAGSYLPHSKLQVNLNFPNIWAEFPFIDCAKQNDRFWQLTGTPTGDPYSTLNDGGYPQSMAAGVTKYTTAVSIYFKSGDPWVLDWTGSGTVVLTYAGSAGPTLTPSGTNPTTYTIGNVSTDGQGLFCTIDITAASALTGIRLYRISQQALLNSGSIFNPDFISLFNSYGRIRYMNYMQTLSSPITSWGQIAKETDFSWTGTNCRKDYWCGNATISANNYTCDSGPVANPSLWTAGQMVQCRLKSAPAFVAITGASNSNPVQITAPSHGFSTGTKIFFPPGTLSGANWNSATGLSSQFLTITNTGANTFTIDGKDSTSWGAGPTTGFVGKQVQFTAGLLPLKPVWSQYRAMINQGLFAAGDVIILTYDSDLDALIMCQGLQSGAALMGLPPSLLVKMANALGISPWFCIPHRADSDYCSQFSALVLANLNFVTCKKVVFEVSNEIFNNTGANSETSWAIGAGLALGAPASTGGTTAYHNWYGLRFYQIMTAITAAFGGSLSKLERTFQVGQTVTTDPAQVLQRFTAPYMGTPVAPITLADSICIAPYIDPNHATTANAEQVWNYLQGGALQTVAFNWLEAQFTSFDVSWQPLNTFINTLFPFWMDVCNTYGILKICEYEGGWGIVPNTFTLTAASFNGYTFVAADKTNFFFDYYRSTYYNSIAWGLLYGFITSGKVKGVLAEFPSQYCIASNWSASTGMWGTYQNNMYSTPVPSLSVLNSWNGGGVS